MTPLEYYELLLRRYGVADLINTTDSEIDRVLAMHNLSITDLKTISRSDLKRGMNWLLEAVFKELLSAVPDEYKQKWANLIMVGEFPTGDFNAHCIRVPNGAGFIFLINFGLMRLIYVYTQILVADLFYKTGSAAEINWNIPNLTHKRLIELLGEAIRKYLNSSNRELFLPFDLLSSDKGFTYAVGMLTTKAEQFVIAHELMHALAGGLGKKPTHDMLIPAGSLSVLKESFQEEYDADIGAASLVLGLSGIQMINQDNPQDDPMINYGFAAPIVVFELAQTIEKAANIRFATHPNSLSRKRRVFKFLQAFPISEGISAHKTFGIIAKDLRKGLYRHNKPSLSKQK